jgi:hypothetical protein
MAAVGDAGCCLVEISAVAALLVVPVSLLLLNR